MAAAAPSTRGPGLSAQDLATAVAGSTSWRQVVEALGMSSASGHRIRTLRERCDAERIPYRHLTGGRAWDYDDLRAAAAAARSWPELLDALGYTAGSGSARATVSRHLERLGLVPFPPHETAADDDMAPFASPPCGANLRKAGSLVVAAVPTMAGHEVSWPLEPAAYDLLVTSAGRIHRVQVKTTTRAQAGTWVCSLSRSAYDADAASRRRRSWYGPDEVDYFAVVDGDLEVYMLPAPLVGGLSAVHLRAYRRYRVGRLGAPDV